MASELRRATTEVDAVTAEHLLAHRRQLHAMPELAFKEFETSRYIAERLEALSPDRLEARVAETGVVADLKGARPGRGVLVRADIDGLPIQEAGELAFRSARRGVMHACGHDVHMTIALEVARAMAERRAQLSGMVRFVFQPAEERGLGAKPMIEAGVLDGIDRVIGLHVWSELPVGQVSVRPGAMMAGADMFTLTIRGTGGHGAQPQYTVDAVVIAAQVVSAIQTLASRETAPAAPVVITLGSIHGGAAANIVANEVVIQGTLRSLDPELRARLLRRIAELAEGIATAMRGHCQFNLESATPPVINDAPVATVVADAARAVVGDAAVVMFEPLMVGEDFAYYLQARPGCFFLLGGAPEGPRVGHHTAEFRIDERCLPVGFRVMTAAVLRLLD